MTLDRFRGCLVGLACGDALGGPVEAIPGTPRTNRDKLHTEMTGGGFFKLVPGQITDDTDMALCLAESLVCQKAFDPAEVAERYKIWFFDNPIGTGKTIEAAMLALKNGVPWNYAGFSEKGNASLGNGSLMRCAPLAMRYYVDDDSLARHSRTDSQLTHPHPNCVYAVIETNWLIAAFLRGESKQQALDHAKGLQKTLLPNLGGPRIEWFSMQDVLSVWQTRETLKKKLKPSSVDLTCHLAYESFFLTDSFEQALVKAANQGGDADTIAAVAGGIAGAFYGEKAIPDRWKHALVDRHGQPVYPRLLELAEQLYSLASEGSKQ